MLILQNIVSTHSKQEDKLNVIEEDIQDHYKKVDKCNEVISTGGLGKIDLDELKRMMLLIAFLHGKQSEGIYMEQPRGLEKEGTEN